MSAPRSEDEWLRAALERFQAGGPDRAHVALDLGHDACALRLGEETIVLTKDVLVDGVHFELTSCGAGLAARKALAVNLSDLAAASARPVGFLVGGVLPKPASRDLLEALMAGFDRAAKELDCPCLGGDTNVAAGPLVLSVTAIGTAGPAGVTSRSGAAPGQLLSVTGSLGGSLVGRHLRFRPRVAEAQALAAAGVPTAMMDLSDGLSRDLPRLCAMSGVGAVLDADDVPVHPDVGSGDREPLWHALHDGEDFELLLSHDPLSDAQRHQLAAADVTLHTLGTVTATKGVFLRRDGQTEPLVARGFDHFD